MKSAAKRGAIFLTLAFFVLFAFLSAGKMTKAGDDREKNRTVLMETSILRVRDEKISRQLRPEQEIVADGALSVSESEPNETTATANSLGVTRIKVTGDIFPNGDIDYYSFYANAGDRVFAATMTAAGQGGANSILDLIATNGLTGVETDDDDGSFGGTSSSIAGAVIPAAGVYYLRVRGSSPTTQIRPYHLYLTVQGGTPSPENEPNDSAATATPVTPGGFMSGVISSASDAADIYSFTANAGDTVYLSLDLDPERDGASWNGRLGLGFFNGYFLLADDGNAASPNSEAFFFTVKETGTYYAWVDPSAAGSGAANFTYNLSVSVIRAKEYKCTTYEPGNPAAQPIGPDPTNPNAVQTIVVPDNKRIAKAQISVDLIHTRMADIDLNITSPLGNEIVLFTDVGSSTPNVSGLTEMDVTFDDEAALPIGFEGFTVVKTMFYQPKGTARLGWLKGENAQGTWTLTARDDTTGEGGTLNRWKLTICEEPALTSIPNLEETIYNADFESNDGGFTHSGTADEWEWGTPSTNVPAAAPITNCFSGVVCWKTDLNNTYDNNSVQDLFSPIISLVNHRGRALKLSWAQKYQMDSASFDHYYVDVTEVGGSGMTRRVFEHRSGNMTAVVGNPNFTLHASSGWSLQEADISDFAGKTIQVKFHVDSDLTGNYAGVAIDDVKVVSLKSPPAADFDGDGGTELSVFRNTPADGAGGFWYLLNVSSQNFTGLQFGFDTDIPVAGDYDGDGNIDIAVFHPGDGSWYITNPSGSSFNVIVWGADGDIPVPGDYDGDGKTDAAVYRPADKTWYIRRSSNGTLQAAVFGNPDDKFVPRDYDGDGKTDIAVFRPSEGAWYIWQSFYGTIRAVQFGTNGDIPVPADYDGDRKADIAVYRPSQGFWVIRNSSSYEVKIIFWGASTDVPVPGDYDRDRKADIAVYRPSSGEWFVVRSTDNNFFGTQFGISSDIPIPSR